MNYKEQIKNMSNAGIADSTIARICNVSIFVIRSILLQDGYEATKRTQDRITRSMERFRKDLGIIS